MVYILLWGLLLWLAFLVGRKIYKNIFIRIGNEVRFIFAKLFDKNFSQIVNYRFVSNKDGAYYQFFDQFNRLVSKEKFAYIGTFHHEKALAFTYSSYFDGTEFIQEEPKMLYIDKYGKPFSSEASIKITQEEADLGRKYGISTPILQHIKNMTHGYFEQLKKHDANGYGGEIGDANGVYLVIPVQRYVPQSQETGIDIAKKIISEIDTHHVAERVIYECKQLSEFSDFQIVLSDHGYNSDYTPNSIIFYKTSHPLDVLDIKPPTPEGELRYMNQYHAWFKRKRFSIIYITYNTMVFKFSSQLTDQEAKEFAKEIYEVSPDTLDNNNLSMSEYIKELKMTATVSLHWS